MTHMDLYIDHNGEIFCITWEDEDLLKPVPMNQDGEDR